MALMVMALMAAAGGPEAAPSGLGLGLGRSMGVSGAENAGAGRLSGFAMGH